MDAHDGAKAPDHVPEEWLERYGTRHHTPVEGLTDHGPDDEQALTQLVSWLAVVTGIGAVVAWLIAGVPGIVALTVPVVAMGEVAVLFVHWAMRADHGEQDVRPR